MTSGSDSGNTWWMEYTYVVHVSSISLKSDEVLALLVMATLWLASVWAKLGNRY